MRPKLLLLCTVFFGLFLLSWKASDKNWIIEKHKEYNLAYMSTDMNRRVEYNSLVEHGMNSVKTFFNSSYKENFSVIIHPDRHSLDSAWQSDWEMPDFRSACWMVASGVASRLDLLSPKMWATEACEHVYTEIKKTQQLVTHELVHVYHGQLNASPDFSNVTGIDWFVEGLATYASGQCDSIRIAEVREAISNNNIPVSLDDFFAGNLKYGLSGSVVMYIDNEYGRTRLNELLPFNRKSELLSALKTTESELIDEWKMYIQKF